MLSLSLAAYDPYRTSPRVGKATSIQTIQVCPKDQLMPPSKAEDAAKRLRLWLLSRTMIKLAALLGGGLRHEAAGIYHAGRRRGGRMSGHRARAAALAGDRLPGQPIG